jgi:hypothetical protein
MKEPAKSQLFLGWLFDSLEGKKRETMVTYSSQVFQFFITLVIDQTRAFEFLVTMVINSDTQGGLMQFLVTAQQWVWSFCPWGPIHKGNNLPGCHQLPYLLTCLQSNYLHSMHVYFILLCVAIVLCLG